MHTRRFFPGRRRFLLQAAGGMAFFSLHPFHLEAKAEVKAGKRIGIIGLDTSHATAFTEAFNAAEPDPALRGYRVVAAYPRGSYNIESSYSRIPKYTARVREMGVEVVDSVEELLRKCDVVLLLTNDGHPHLEQAVQVMRKGYRLFIDKPLAGSLSEAIAIFRLAQRFGVPVFSSSSLRYTPVLQEIAAGSIGEVYGATTYGPCKLEPSHPDLFWYGIHAVEMLYTVMGMGCERVTRVHTDITDVAVGVWKGGRTGTFRGMRVGKYEFGGTAFGEKGNASLGGYPGYGPLLKQIAAFFESGVPPVSPEETLEIYTFMESADESRRRGGVPVAMKEVREEAEKKSEAIIRRY